MKERKGREGKGEGIATKVRKPDFKNNIPELIVNATRTHMLLEICIYKRAGCGTMTF